MKTAKEINVRSAIIEDRYCGSAKELHCCSDAGAGMATLEEYRGELKEIITRHENAEEEGLSWPGPNGCTMATGREIASLARGELDTMEGAEDRYNEAWAKTIEGGMDESAAADEADSAIYNY